MRKDNDIYSNNYYDYDNYDGYYVYDSVKTESDSWYKNKINGYRL